MNSSEAKTILSGYDLSRANSLPQEALEALDFARSDAELSLWLEGQLAFDECYRSELREIPIPEGLEARILQAAASATEGAAETISISQEPCKPGRRNLILALAAALALLGAIAYLVFPSGGPATVETFREGMAKFASNRFSLDHFTDDLSAAKAWLDEKGYPSYPEVPEQFVRFKGMGCKTIDWNGQKVGLVCFVNDRHEIIHLFVIERSVLENIDSKGELIEAIAVHHGLETSGWNSEKYTFMLVGSDPNVRLAPLLAAN